MWKGIHGEVCKVSLGDANIMVKGQPKLTKMGQMK